VIRGRGPPSWRVTQLSSPGVRAHHLAVLSPEPATAATRLAEAAGHFLLTPRQTQVLALLMRGHANKTIAVTLRCAENTVEYHVSQLLRRTGTDSRAALVALVWGGSP